MFKPTYHNQGVYGNMGLVMNLPGINNFDTMRYISKAMTQDFKGFSLQFIAKQLELEVQKGNTQHMQFNAHWYERSDYNAQQMCEYNIIDCLVTLGICWKLDLFNQILNMCYATNCSIEDALVYSTGAISVSTLCSYAYNKGVKFVWTKCDWRPSIFEGGLVWFRGIVACPQVCIIDFGTFMQLQTLNPTQTYIK